MKVRGVTITSSSALPPLALPTPSPCNARSSATVPLATAMAWLLSDQAANSRSKARHSSPVPSLPRLDSRTAETATDSSCVKLCQGAQEVLGRPDETGVGREGGRV